MLVNKRVGGSLKARGGGRVGESVGVVWARAGAGHDEACLPVAGRMIATFVKRGWCRWGAVVVCWQQSSTLGLLTWAEEEVRKRRAGHSKSQARSCSRPPSSELSLHPWLAPVLQRLPKAPARCPCAKQKVNATAIALYHSIVQLVSTRIWPSQHHLSTVLQNNALGDTAARMLG